MEAFLSASERIRKGQEYSILECLWETKNAVKGPRKYVQISSSIEYGKLRTYRIMVRPLCLMLGGNVTDYCVYHKWWVWCPSVLRLKL